MAPQLQQKRPSPPRQPLELSPQSAEQAQSLPQRRHLSPKQMQQQMQQQQRQEEFERQQQVREEEDAFDAQQQYEPVSYSTSRETPRVLSAPTATLTTVRSPSKTLLAMDAAAATRTRSSGGCASSLGAVASLHAATAASDCLGLAAHRPTSRDMRQ